MTDHAPWYDEDNEDTDGDGMNDSEERQCHTNPEAEDSDDNGVLDTEEDTDGDGYTNIEELEEGTSCADATSNPDSFEDE